MCGKTESMRDCVCLYLDADLAEQQAANNPNPAKLVKARAERAATHVARTAAAIECVSAQVVTACNAARSPPNVLKWQKASPHLAAHPATCLNLILDANGLAQGAFRGDALGHLPRTRDTSTSP